MDNQDAYIRASMTTAQPKMKWWRNGILPVILLLCGVVLLVVVRGNGFQLFDDFLRLTAVRIFSVLWLLALSLFGTRLSNDNSKGRLSVFSTKRKVMRVSAFILLILSSVWYINTPLPPNKMKITSTHDDTPVNTEMEWNAQFNLTTTYQLPKNVSFQNFVLSWDCVFWAKAPGVYTFQSLFDDGFFLSIDGRALITALDHQGSAKKQQGISLTKGFHSLKVVFRQSGGPFHCIIRVKEPMGKWRLLGNKLLIKEQPTSLGSFILTFAPMGDKVLTLISLLSFLLFLIVHYLQKRTTRKDLQLDSIVIFLVSTGTLLSEVVLTRIFSVIYFNHLTFFIISTALFGFGFSGILLYLVKPLKAMLKNRLLYVGCILAALSIPVTLTVVCYLPISFEQWESFYSSNFVKMIGYYLAVALPFFFAGLVLSALFSKSGEKANQLYFFDLAGASLGCVLPLFLLRSLTGSGTLLFAAWCFVSAALLISLSLKLIYRYGVLVVLILLTVLSLLFQSLFPIQSHESKRDFLHQLKRGWIEFTRWSALSRIDVSHTSPYRTIWIDGGTNQSFILPFDGNFAALKPMGDPDSIPYRLTKPDNCLIIGPAGGKEVMIALSHGATHVDAVEMDPGIVSILSKNGVYVPFSGGLYNNSRVAFVNDEGRSFLKRATSKYSVIQQINNATPVSIASGAFNLSETYLLTREAFNDYWQHLKEGGFLSITRWGAVRLCSLAYDLLRSKGIADPWNYVAVFQNGDDVTRQYFLMKKGKINNADLAIMRQYGLKELFTPQRDTGSLYSAVLNPESHDEALTQAGFNLFPVTDDRPFFNHFHKMYLLAKTTPKNQQIAKLLRGMRHPDKTPVLLLFEAAFLAFVFILMPLIKSKQTVDNNSVKSLLFVLYFVSIGLGFILIEMTYIQKFILFMGHPAYSVSTVLFSILLSAGIGSYLSKNMRLKISSLMKIYSALLIVIGFQFFLLPLFFSLLLGWSTGMRFIASCLFIAPLGILMGMPFPMGLKFLHSVNDEAIPWAWGLNSYATVVGSVLCVIIAVNFGFKVVLCAAFVLYAIAMLAGRTLFNQN